MIAAGYIAIARTIFDRREFRRRPKWLVAWEWLIGAAAWKPQGCRGDWGVVHVERGELATTIRTLAEQWRWPKSNVDCFLRWLVREEMVELTTTRTATRTTGGKSLPHLVTIIRLCNYDKFQKPSKVRASHPGQEAGQEPGQAPQQAFEFTDEALSQPLNQTTKEQQEKGNGFFVEKDGNRSRGRKKKPHHGAKSEDGKFIWTDHGTQDWEIYAKDYREVRGVEIFPENRAEGRGNWFSYHGEAARPKRKRRAIPWTKTTSSAKSAPGVPLNSPTRHSEIPAVRTASLRPT